MNRVILVAACLLFLAAGSCGGGRNVRNIPDNHANALANYNALAQQPAVEWPGGLPVDKAQPWETLDGAGRVVSSINLQSQFIPGVERFLEAGSVSDLGEASSFASGAPGAENVSWAIYRIPMGAEQPGTIAADANLRLISDSAESAYYIGVGDYSANTWRWHGPFAVSHVRINLPPAAYTSSLGNLMLAVVAYDGADFDLVGLGVNAFDEDDFTAPPAPSAPTLTPVAGGVLAEWVPVVAADLAGYRVYANSNNVFDYIEGGTSAFIPAASDVAVTLSAVDISGNESAQSAAANAAPLAGSVPVVQLAATSPSGNRGDIISLTASGADSYDWDTDGDGTWDITADTTGSAFANTANMGIIRPALRAHAAGDGFWMGAVSLIIGGNSRPVVSASVSPQTGKAPLAVNFTLTAADDDGTIAEYAWDFDGDGIYDGISPNDPSPLSNTYSLPGLYNAKFRATDNEGSWDVDTVAINVLTIIPPMAIASASPLVAFLGEQAGSEVSVQLSGAGSYSPMGDTLHYYFKTGASDWIDNADVTNYTAWYNMPGVYQVQVLVFDEEDNYDIASIQVKVYRFGSTRISPDNGNDLGMWDSLCVHNGLPFVAYRDETNHTIFGSLAQDSTGLSWGSQFNLDAIAMGDNDGLNGTSCKSFGSDGIGIAFYNITDGALMYSALYQAGGAMTATVDWAPGGDLGAYPTLISLDGVPAISYFDWINAKLFYIYATDSSGGTWNPPIEITGDAAGESSLAFGGGTPMLAYHRWSDNALCFTHGLDMQGNTWASPTVVDNSVSCSAVSLIWLAGRPAIAYYDTTNMDLRYICAADSNGDTWNPPAVIDAAGNVGEYCSLAFLPSIGCVGISYMCEPGELRFAQSVDLLGTSWNPPITVRQGLWDLCRTSSMMEVEGLPGIAYYNAGAWSCNFAYPRIN